MTKFDNRLPEAVMEDTVAFRTEVDKYLSGETSAVAFRGIRVPMGIYEQRENDTFMVRVRGAAGVFLLHQAKLVADLSETYGNGIVHVTTRQDLQIHGVRIEDTPAILERLLEVGLTSRGGGGNTVRNISACPLAGVCEEEVFDVTPYALALTNYLIRERGNFNLPRKFKTSFSGCGKDCGLASVADLGFFAHKRDGVRGFAVYAGGGMGAHSALAVRIEEFVPDENIFEVAEAVKRLFDKHGDRANRNKARLRFVVQRLGKDQFIKEYREELELVRQEQIKFPKIEKSTDAELTAIPVYLSLGDIPAHRLKALAAMLSNLKGGTIRATQEQCLQLRVPRSQVDGTVAALRKIDARLVQPRNVRCVACAGASTCKLGLCLSKGLAAALETELQDIVHPSEVVIRISGCPNSCGHHPISPLGLYGSAARIRGRLVPFYTIMAGGHLAEGEAVLAEPIARVPAKAVPAMLREFWAAAAVNRREAESLHELMDRWGSDYLRELAKHYQNVPKYEDEPDFYRDFGSSVDFSLAGRGPGECGAGVTDVIMLDIDDARRSIEQNRLYDAVVAASRALLVTKGLEPKKDREVFAAFSEHFIDTGWVERQTQSVLDAALDFKLGDRDSLDDFREHVKALVSRINELFLSLDSNLNFRAQRIEESVEVDAANNPDPAFKLDLRGVACPMNFVHAKLRLEEIDIGQVLEILLDNGEPVRNVPASFDEQGQEVLSVVDEHGHYCVSVLRRS